MSEKVTIYGCFEDGDGNVCVESCEAVEHSDYYYTAARIPVFRFSEQVPKEIAFKTKQEAVEAFISKCQEEVKENLAAIKILNNQIEQAQAFLK